MGPRHDAGLGTAGPGRCPDHRQFCRSGLVGVQQFQPELGRWRRIHRLGRRLVGVEFDRRGFVRRWLHAFRSLRPVQFVLAIAVARGVRYFALGFLAITYGEAAVELMRTRGRVVALWVAGLIVLGAVTWWLWRRRRRPIPAS